MNKILFISVENDPHALRVKEAVIKHDFETVHVFVDHFPLATNLSSRISSRGDLVLKILDENGNEEDFYSFDRVYCRPYSDDIFNISHKSPIVHNFLQRESYFLLKMIWEFMKKDDALWINPWGFSDIAANKGLQMRMATELGFNIPKTLITSSPKEAIHFIKEIKSVGGRVVLKTITGFKNTETKERGGSSVSVIEEEELGSNNYPLVLQEYVSKNYELRVTVVGDKVFPCKITSQDSPDEVTRVDWRIYDFKNVKFLPTEIPENVAQKCIAMTKMLGLNYSAIDIIYEPNGGYRFLELNPNGLWLWIEELAGLPITEAIADLLIK